MEIHLEPMSAEDRKPVIDIFNTYIENSFAAYPERKVPYEFFDGLRKMSGDYPTVVVKDGNGEVLGYGMFRPYNPIPTFSRTAEIVYFIKPDHTHRGIGSRMLAHLIREGRKKALASILASISSLNEASLKFHKKNGFVECGRFQGIGKKNGRIFDIIWMQKIL